METFVAFFVYTPYICIIQLSKMKNNKNTNSNGLTIEIGTTYYYRAKGTGLVQPITVESVLHGMAVGTTGMWPKPIDWLYTHEANVPN